MLRIGFYTLVFLLLALSSCKTDEAKVSPDSIDTLPPQKETPQFIVTEKDERLTWQKPEDVIAYLGDIKEKTIADLGAGIGYFSFKLLSKCKKVIAIDIDKDAVQILQGFHQSLDSDLKNKFEVRLASNTDPQLKDNEVDIIFIVNTITYIDNRATYLSNLKRFLKPDGQIVIVDFKTKRIPGFTNSPSMSDRIYMHVLEDELENAGYSLIGTDDTTLDYQYIMSAKI